MTRALTPLSLEEARGYLESEPGLLPVAGGTDLMVAPAVERARLEKVMDLTRLPELRGIREAEGAVAIGAATPFAEIRRSPLVQEHLPALAAAAAVIGGWQIQSRATLGGNMANASPAGDSLPVLLALEAEVEAVGPGGWRTIPYSSFHVAYRQTALAPGEIIAQVRIPLPPAGSRQAFRKVGTREAQAISKVVVALWAQVEGGLITDLRLAAGSVAPTPVRLPGAEAAARGRELNAETATAAGRAAAAEVSPIDDVRSTAAYRRFALERVVRRLLLSLEPAGG